MHRSGIVLVLGRREWDEAGRERGTYGCFTGRLAFGVPASVGGAFAVLCGYVSLVKADVMAGWAGLVLSTCCFMNFSLAPEPPGVLVGMSLQLCGDFEVGRELWWERCRGVRGVNVVGGRSGGV